MSALQPDQRVTVPAVYAHQADRLATVVRVSPATRQLWVRFDGDDTVREISTFHARPLSEGEDATGIGEEES